MEFIFFCLQLYQRYASLQVLLKIFAQICFAVIYKEIFEILRTSVSQETFQDRRQRSEKVLDAQVFGRKSNYTEMAKYTCNFRHEIYCNIQQNLAKQFALHSAEAYSEPFPTSKQGGYVIGGNYFYKNLHLRCFKSF